MNHQTNLYNVEELKEKGINYKGFGIIPKAVMQDRELTLEAKTIYAYLCSFSGKKGTAFPATSKIIKDLLISKSTYYKHFKLLHDNGYISIQKSKATKGHFSHNIYSLLVPKSNGYGTIPKTLMTDTRLDIKTKGIYAYFSSLFGNVGSAFPSRKKIFFDLKISEATYHKHFRRLIEFNYIRAEQRHENGKLSVNDYYLVNTPTPENVIKKAVRVIVGGIRKAKTNKVMESKKAAENKFKLLDTFMYGVAINRFRAVICNSKLNIDTLSCQTIKSLVERFEDVSATVDHWYSYIQKMLVGEINNPTEYPSFF